MKGLPFVLAFTAMTFLAWGSYGPVLHHGAVELKHDSMRAFVGVGLAYFLIAVIFPLLILSRGGEVGRWTLTGAIASLVAGAVGAIGALGIILALGYGGKTVYVMPLVFGFAPVVNTLVTAALSKTFSQISPIFLGGILAAALGAGGVLVFKPTPAPATSPVAEQMAEDTEQNQESTSSAEDESDSGDTTKDGQATTELSSEASANEFGDDVDGSADADDNSSSDDSESNSDEPDSEVTSVASDQSEAEHADDGHSAGGHTAGGPESSTNVLGIVVSIIIAALCWGSYGPMLHIGQAKMQGSRMRPFACVGLAYFFIAVAVPLVLISSRVDDPGAWTGNGMLWSFLAGVAGAIGALGVLLAFNAGGKPYYVMPLIFGFAPVINTFISLTLSGTWDQAGFAFWASLAVVIAGVVVVLTKAPKPKKAPMPKTA